MSPRPFRILVVDDEELVRDIAVEALRDHGFDVAQAASGSDALAILGISTIDLLLTDIRMPGMDGIELARAARGLQPALKVIFVSGYATDAAATASLAILRKPFRIGSLVARVEEELGIAAPRPGTGATVQHLLARGELLRERVERERIAAVARQQKAREAISNAIRTQRLIATQWASQAAFEPRFLSFYKRWFEAPQSDADPEHAVRSDDGAPSLTLWRRGSDDFECRFCGDEVDLRFGGNISGGWLRALAPLNPSGTSAAYDDVLRSGAPILLERRLESGARNRELVLPMSRSRATYLVSAHLFAD